MRETTSAGRPAVPGPCRSRQENVQQVSTELGLCWSSVISSGICGRILNCCCLVLPEQTLEPTKTRVSVLKSVSACVRVTWLTASRRLALLLPSPDGIQQNSRKAPHLACFADVVCRVVGGFFLFSFGTDDFYHPAAVAQRNNIISFFLPPLCLPQTDLNNSKAPI